MIRLSYFSYDEFAIMVQSFYSVLFVMNDDCLIFNIL
jgi:hypothetical protein